MRWLDKPLENPILLTSAKWCFADVGKPIKSDPGFGVAEKLSAVEIISRIYYTVGAVNHQLHTCVTGLASKRSVSSPDTGRRLLAVFIYHIGSNRRKRCRNQLPRKT